MGARVPPAPPRRRVPLGRRPRRAALRARRLRRLRRHRGRHPRAQADGGAAARGRPSASTRSPRRCSAACCRSGCRDSTGSSWRRATCPPARGAAIGGDWYDALELDDGRVAVVVGDVVGHGLRAAATMGQLRNAFRAYGLVESIAGGGDGPRQPAAGSRRRGRDGDRALPRDRPRDAARSSTRAPATRRRSCWPTAGRASSRAGARCRSGRPTPSPSARARATLPPGSTLLLYTDGLVERRDTPLADRLARAGRSPRRPSVASSSSSATRCSRGVLGPRDPGDDVALLAVRLEPVSARAAVGCRCRRTRARSAPLRRRLARFLHAAGRRRARDVRDHAHDLRGGRQRDRARLRTGRRELSRWRRS